ncbi:MAG: heme-binding domain-containing protein [Gaiellales bacterium]
MRTLRPTRRVVLRVGLALVLLFALIQLVPYGRSTHNPPVTRAAQFPDATTSRLFASACGDCHSNLTKRWWLTRIAPASWLAENDIRGGRENLNVSAWDRPQEGVDDVVEAVEGGGMPPLQYKLFHGDARLSDAQRQQLAAGLRRLYATDPPAATR